MTQDLIFDKIFKSKCHTLVELKKTSENSALACRTSENCACRIGGTVNCVILVIRSIEESAARTVAADDEVASVLIRVSGLALLELEENELVVFGATI